MIRTGRGVDPASATAAFLGSHIAVVRHDVTMRIADRGANYPGSEFADHVLIRTQPEARGSCEGCWGVTLV